MKDKNLSDFNKSLQEMIKGCEKIAKLKDPVETMEAYLNLRLIFREVWIHGFTEGFEIGSKNIERELKK